MLLWIKKGEKKNDFSVIIFVDTRYFLSDKFGYAQSLYKDFCLSTCLRARSKQTSLLASILHPDLKKSHFSTFFFAQQISELILFTETSEYNCFLSARLIKVTKEKLNCLLVAYREQTML